LLEVPLAVAIMVEAVALVVIERLADFQLLQVFHTQ
jgi:hypothetical protein